MGGTIIHKPAADRRVAPDLIDYTSACSTFARQETERTELAGGLPGARGIDIAHQAVDLHAVVERAGAPAGPQEGRRPRVSPLAARVAEERGVEIPQADHPTPRTPDGRVTHLESRVGSGAAGA